MANESQNPNSTGLSARQEVQHYVTTPEFLSYQADLNRKIRRVAAHLKAHGAAKPHYKNMPDKFWKGLAAGSPNL